MAGFDYHILFKTSRGQNARVWQCIFALTILQHSAHDLVFIVLSGVLIQHINCWSLLFASTEPIELAAVVVSLGLFVVWCCAELWQSYKNKKSAETPAKPPPRRRKVLNWMDSVLSRQYCCLSTSGFKCRMFS